MSVDPSANGGRTVRSRPLAALGIGLAVVTIVAIAAVAIWAAFFADDDHASGSVLVDGALFPAALEAMPDGGLLYGERETGNVRRVDPDGTLVEEPVATVEVASERQRGLLGLAVIDDGLYAAYTRASDRRLVVSRIDAGRDDLVWAGEISTDLANGGHIEAMPDGRLLLGVGEQGGAVGSGRLLVLDPDAGPEQEPAASLDGFHNPFAFAVDDTTIWVADNAPGTEPERLSRIDLTTFLAGEVDPVTGVRAAGAVRAPSGLVLDGDSVLVCGFVSGQLERLDLLGAPELVAEPCDIGVARLTDGRLVLASGDELRVVDPG